MNDISASFNGLRFLYAILELEEAINDFKKSVEIDGSVQAFHKDKIDVIRYKANVLIVETFLYFIQNNRKSINTINKHITINNMDFLIKARIIHCFKGRVLSSVDRNSLYDKLSEIISKDINVFRTRDLYIYWREVKRLMQISREIYSYLDNEDGEKRKKLNAKAEERMTLIETKLIQNLHNTISNEVNLTIDPNGNKISISESRNNRFRIISVIISILLFLLILLIYKVYYN